jgi:large subunit ribosomal protein L10
MNKREKELLIKNLAADFKQSDAIFVISCPTLTAQANQGLRKKFRSINSKMCVAKNTLLLRVAEQNNQVKEIANLFSNQITLVFAGKEKGIEVASLIKANGLGTSIKILGGIFQNTVISQNKFEFIASIPSKEVLYAQLCGVLLAPISKLAFVLKAASEKANN